jgi:hypothetical protein
VYGIFTYIYPTTGPNVGKYTIHGASGNINMVDFSQTSFSETREVGILRHPCERIVMLLGKPEIETIILPNKLDSPVEFSLFCFYQDSATGGG